MTVKSPTCKDWFSFQLEIIIGIEFFLVYIIICMRLKRARLLNHILGCTEIEMRVLFEINIFGILYFI